MTVPHALRRIIVWTAAAVLLAGCLAQPVIKADPNPTAEVTPAPTIRPEIQSTERPMPSINGPFETAFDMNARLGRGVNLGNALEGPREGAWGVTLQEEYFALIKEKGFDSVRVPIRWNAHAAEQAPYTIDPVFFERIDWVVAQALKNDLAVMLNIHHYDEFVRDPVGQRERWLALWEQIGARYADAPETVLFELLNEPNGSAMTPAVWNELAAAGLAVVRERNPNRYVVIGPVNWNNIDALGGLRLPEDDRRIIATFHYYSPFQFTHQGAEWADGADAWLGQTWEGSADEQSAVIRDLEKARRWSEANDRPVFLGEFGAYSKADMESRARWTAFVAREAEARGLSWSYWEFCSGFGIYDAALKTFREPLVEALLP